MIGHTSTNDSESYDNGLQKVEQPPTYPKQETGSVSQHPPTKPKSTETYIVMKEGKKPILHVAIII